MYYKIKDSIKRKEIGHYPQNDNVRFFGDPFAKNSFGLQGKYGKLELEPALLELSIHKKSKITNYLSVVVISSNTYKVIDVKLLNFLEPYLPNHQYWKIDAVKNDEKFVYYILHISESSHAIFDFEKSAFFTMPHQQYINKAQEGTHALKDFISSLTENRVQFANNDAYLALLEKHKKQAGERMAIIPQKVIIDASKIHTHIFRIMTRINNLSGYYVSEELKNKLQENNFTGMDFEPITEINKVFEVQLINL